MRLLVLVALLVSVGCADSESAADTPERVDGVEPTESAIAGDADGDGDAFTEDSPALLAALRRSLGDSTDVQYRAAAVDLDGDGRNEIVAHVVGSSVCGSGGCATYVFTPDADSLRGVGTMSVSRAPIAVSVERANGWLDLLVSVSGGGIDAGIARVRYTGDAYPGNPTRQTMTDEVGTVLIDPQMMDDARSLDG